MRFAIFCLLVWGPMLFAEPPASFCHNCSQSDREHWVRHYVADPPLLQELVRQHVEALRRAVFIDCSNAVARRQQAERLTEEAERTLPPNATLRERENVIAELVEPDDILTRFLAHHQPFRQAVTAYLQAARPYAAHRAEIEQYAQLSDQLPGLRQGAQVGGEAELKEAERELARLEHLLPAGVQQGNRGLHEYLRAIENSLLGFFPQGQPGYSRNTAHAQLTFQNVTLWQLARMRVALHEPIPPHNRPMLMCAQPRALDYTREEAVRLVPPFVHTLTFDRVFLNGQLYPSR